MLELAVRHGTQLAVAVLVLCVLGVVAALRVPVQMIPDLEVRTISVRTTWPGATPQDVEQEIVIEQEEYLRNIPNLQRMISTAATGEAIIELEFPFGVDLDDALIRVNNALSQVPGYPENVDEPRLLTSSFSENAFMFFRVEPLPGHPVAADMHRMQDFVDDHVRTRMERVPGVSQVQLRGGAERQVRIVVDPGRLAASGIGLVELRDAIRARNRDVSAGDVDAGKRRYLLRTEGRFRDLRDVEQLIVARRGDALIRLRDVARVELGTYELRSQSFVNGQPALNLSVRRETGSNVIAIKEALLPVVAEINRDVLEPAGMRMSLTSDDVRYVQASIANVWKNLAIGALLASGVLFLFLRSLPATLCGVVGVPVCTIAAFLGLLVAGRTINVISLAGVAFAIGMTLDNSIVVLESIERERRRGAAALAASLAGVRRVWSAVLASTLTTVLVFAPVLFVREEAGQLFSDIAIAVSASILASMAVAVTVVPALAARVSLTPRGGAARSGALRARVVAALGWLVATGPRRLAGVFGTAAATLAILLALTPPAEYLPEGEEAKIFASMIAPPGYNLPEMTALAERLQAELVPHVEAGPEAFARGDTDVPPLAWLNVIVTPERIFLVSEPLDPADVEALGDALTTRFREVPGMRAFASRGSIITSNDGGTRSVNLDIAGNELADVYRTAGAAYRRAREVFVEPQIGSEPASLALAQPLIRVVPDWERVAELDLTAEGFGFVVSALTDGAYVDELLLAGEKVDLFVFGADGRDGAPGPGGLAQLPLHAPQGAVVPVGALATIEEVVDTDTIRRVDGRRTVTLNVIPPRSVALETAVERVRSEVLPHVRAAGDVPAGVSVDISGASDQLDATRAALGANFGVSLVLCYLVLVAIFTHWGYPLVIMTTVPLGIAGGIAGLWLLNAVGGLLPLVGAAPIRQPFDMITMLGFLILLGTVVNNPILVVDRTLRNVRDEGMAHADAVREAVDARLRPMMMTTITTVFGLAPLVFLPGAGTELYRGVGAIVLFGLLFATLVTIVFLPSLLATLLDLRTRFAGTVPGRRG